MSMQIPEINSSMDLLRNIIWQYDGTEEIQTLMQKKEEWYNKAHTDFWHNWFTDVFDLRTANDFGLSVWALILGVNLFIPECPNVTLTTEQKRLVCRLRYYQLITRCTIPEVNGIMMDMFATENGKAYALDPNDMSSIMYVFTEQPASAVALILTKYDLLPRPATVGLKFRVIRYIPFGFGIHYQNFENAGFWDGGELINYSWRINLFFDNDNGVLHGQIASSDSTIDLSGIDVTLYYTKSTGEAFTREVTTTTGGLFTDLVSRSGIYAVIAKTQIFTPTCTIDDVASRNYTFTYVINGAEVMIKIYNPDAPLFNLTDSSEVITIDFGDGVDSEDYRVDAQGFVYATRPLLVGTVYRITIKRSNSCVFYHPSLTFENKVTEIIYVSGGRQSMTNAFRYCNELALIQAGAFDYLPNVTTFNYAFNGCSQLQLIPDDLFKHCPRVVNFGYLFLSCESLLYIPAGLFDDNPLVTTFQFAFRYCTLLKEIPTGLFDNNTFVTSFQVVFGSCTALLTVPYGLFDKSPAATVFENVFRECSLVTSDINDIFPLEKYSAIKDLWYAFNGCSKMSGSGLVFIAKVPNVTDNTKTFTGAISLSDYSQIPTSWR
ncbi:DUF2612 domain-containing protein [Yersinia pekkanenii]|uniref:Protein of uncharacterized function (DUF2612) n=1 Tax=Yersinia pekkanenii TaxID=1288385 RepID=A0A0T9R7G2_9GAMM|nr:DUF2612 domain-containing protein [Yersinia pekkanenii]CNI48651.1 Protein of uncharacterised function (DUF2612) [Yersinia pekkanenii]CRY68223.1 Protein of uncharacterised function (DUF2612) [Yersinia pekkanenii]